MSTRITAGYDGLVAMLNTLFPSASGWQRLPNPYKPEANNERFLSQAWGIAIGSGLNTNRMVGGNFSVDRGFVITLSRKYEALESDFSAKALVELALFEDQYKLINALENDVTVDGTTMYARYAGDGGIEFVRGDKNNFLMLRTQAQLEYIERLT